MQNLSDAELLAERVALDAEFQRINQRLYALNRENDRREWARHAKQQSEVIVNARGDGVTVAS